jgi:hypothetical protein
MSHAATQTLAELARQRRRLLEGLAALGARQGQLLDDGDTTTLLELLATKQRLIVALGHVERSLDPHRSDEPGQRQWASERQRAECAEDLRVGSALLTEVLDRERDHEQRASARRDEVARQLAAVRTAHAAASAYQPHTRGPASGVVPDFTTAAMPLDLTAGS